MLLLENNGYTPIKTHQSDWLFLKRVWRNLHLFPVVHVQTQQNARILAPSTEPVSWLASCPKTFYTLDGIKLSMEEPENTFVPGKLDGILGVNYPTTSVQSLLLAQQVRHFLFNE